MAVAQQQLASSGKRHHKPPTESKVGRLHYGKSDSKLRSFRTAARFLIIVITRDASLRF